jgi:CRP-like cAMP-binding protein
MKWCSCGDAKRHDFENGVLAALTPTDYARLTPNIKRVRLEAGSTLNDFGSTSDHAWFVTSGIVSLLTTTETAAIDRD